MADEKLVPKLRFSGFEDTWVKEKLGNLVEIKSGKSPTNLINPNGKYPYFKVEQLNNCNKYLIKTPYFINDDSLLIKQGSLIFPKRGMAIMANKIRLLANDSFMDTNLMTLTTKSDINNEFLFYFLTNEELSKLADTTSVPQLNNKHINPYPIYIPTIKEQEKIANFLSIVDKKIELLIKKHQSFLDFKKYLMQQIFAQKLRFIDEPWVSKKLGKLCKITMGQSPSSSNYTENELDTVLIQGNADLINGKVVPRIYTSEVTKTANPGDIILTVRAPVGDLAINEYKSCIGRGVCSIEGNKFIYYFLQTLKDKHVWEKLSQGSTFESINSNDIKNLNVKIPSNKTQKLIYNFLTLVDNKIELLEKKYQQYQKFKKGLLQQMFI